MRTLFTWLAIVILAFNLSGCFGTVGGAANYAAAPEYAQPLQGQVSPVGLVAVVRYVNLIMQDRMPTNSVVLINDAKNLVTFGFRHAASWAYICIKGDSVDLCKAILELGGKGTQVNSTDWRILVDTAEKLGWRQATPADVRHLFPGLTAAIEATTGVLNSLSTALTSPLILPVFPELFVNPWQTEVSEWQ